MSSRVGLWGPVAIYMAAIFTVSADPSPPVPGGVSDKLLHVVAYLGLGIVVCRAVTGGIPRRVTRAAAALTLLITVGYGVTDELHQLFVPGRSADPFDLIADAAGATAGLMACWAWGIIAVSEPRDV